MRGVTPPAQRINLLPPVPQRKGYDITPAALGWVLVGGVVLLASGYFLLQWRVDELQGTRTQLQAQLSARQADLARLRKQVPSQQPDPVLQAELRRLLMSRQQLRQAVALIETEALQGRGFAEWLRALARHPVTGLWLDQVEVAANGRELLIRGFSQSPESVPRLLQSLGQEPVFRGRSFGELSMQRESREQPGALQFELRSLPGEMAGG